MQGSGARHICQEARVVLCSLRGGPPAVARGELAHDLQDLRVFVRSNERVTESFAATESVTGSESITTTITTTTTTTNITNDPNDVGPYVRPFLAVIMDPRAAGPHTLVALRALVRLLRFQENIPFSPEPLMRGVLQCKFEQTDAGADEAVEMAIADLLTLLVTKYSTLNKSSKEEIVVVSSSNNNNNNNNDEETTNTTQKQQQQQQSSSMYASTIMDAFHTIFVTRNTFVHSPALCYHFEDVLHTFCTSIFTHANADASKLILEFLVSQLLHTPPAGVQEAQMAHDATRVLCLKLTRTCILTTDYWNNNNKSNPLLPIIQDDLCLALLMTGQAIWTGFVSMNVLSEVCATISALWNSPLLHLLQPQLETIVTGFYQRALRLLRQRPHPMDSIQFNENLVFDAELEVILESLVDLLCISPDKTSPLEHLFGTYDCNTARSDVAEQLILELSKSCGALTLEDGDDAILLPDPRHRTVPPHLKELCAEALWGTLKTLFTSNTEADAADHNQDQPHDLDHASALPPPPPPSSPSSKPTNQKLSHRTIKSKKRQFKRAAKLFNEKPSKGIDFLVKNGLIQETPAGVACFIRNGLVLGLDKAVAGQYLGALGKPAHKSPPCWERDWFHKKCLEEFCGTFMFEHQSLLDGLRMFLASFRLPGEGQMIDRIVQAFADSCGKQCDESAKRHIFSEDPKRASDTAFLLAYSIIMLNTDQHNPNMKEDKKMSLDAFVRNNANYGRDITEPGKELPRDFLEGVYESIREEEIRTEEEGAAGNMTVERWKDVLRGPTVTLAEAQDVFYDAVDLKELVMETICQPIVSAIGAFWAREVQPALLASANDPLNNHTTTTNSGMLSAQGARLGMDLALELMTGLRTVGRLDLFQKVFDATCGYTGLLLRKHDVDAVERTFQFCNSVEAQSAVICCIRIAHEAGNDLGIDGWSRMWALLFELRDLKLLSRHTIVQESDLDLLSPNRRREWRLKLAKGGFDSDVTDGGTPPRPRSFLGAMGRALFGSDDVEIPAATPPDTPDRQVPQQPRVYSVHGKDEMYLWDEVATSDDEDDGEIDDSEAAAADQSRFSSAGAIFESQLIHEDMLIQHQTDTPVTGLERVEDTRRNQISPRARVRKRLARACDFAGLVSESRFMELNGATCLLEALVHVLGAAKNANTNMTDDDAFADFVLSPASEAFAEVLLCEIAIKNKDRLAALWSAVLRDHYSRRLKALAAVSEDHVISSIEPGTEKCVTGLLRLCACAVQKVELANDAMAALSALASSASNTPREIEELDKHIAEGIWRICSRVDGLSLLNETAWQHLLDLLQWCAERVGKSSSLSTTPGGLPEDDAGLQAYRSLHLILHHQAPFLSPPRAICNPVATLVQRTAEMGSSKLSLASIDLLHLLQSRIVQKICAGPTNDALVKDWVHALEAISGTGGYSHDWVLRSHAISILTDAFLDKQGTLVPPGVLRVVIPQVCIGYSKGRIAVLLEQEIATATTEDVMIEFEQCVSLIFKPFLHHAKSICQDPLQNLELIWTALLQAMEQLLQLSDDEEQPSSNNNDAMTPGMLRWTLKELASEHLRNAIMVIHSHNKLADGMDTMTWEAIEQMSFCKHLVPEWKQGVKEQGN